MCNHANTAPITWGHIFVSYGEYDDNVQWGEVCLDCGDMLELEPEPPDNFNPDDEFYF